MLLLLPLIAHGLIIDNAARRILLFGLSVIEAGGSGKLCKNCRNQIGERRKIAGFGNHDTGKGDHPEGDRRNACQNNLRKLYLLFYFSRRLSFASPKHLCSWRKAAQVLDVCCSGKAS